MGIYYRSISKRSIVDRNGKRIALTNFFGKAPTLFNQDTAYEGRWNRFLTRAGNTAPEVTAEYVIMGEPENGASVFSWTGKAVMSDSYWDKANYIGKLIDHGKGKTGRWEIKREEIQHESV